MADSYHSIAASPPHSDSALARAAQLAQTFQAVRSLTETLCQPLLVEDYGVQSMPDVSPPKWHLAHTTWFFEKFILAAHSGPSFQPFHPLFHFLFNSYYKSAGPHFERHKRGLLSRPGVEEVYRYRSVIDQKILELLDRADGARLEILAPLVTLGIQHEQQHQELLLMDIKHILWANPIRPSYFPATTRLQLATPPTATRVLSFPEGVHSIGASPQADFAFDNEKPRHRVFLEAFGIHSQPVSCGEYLEFIEAGGYDQPVHWLSLGWDQRLREGWSAPLYWEKNQARYQLFTLNGMKDLDLTEPVSHLSYFEADAFARWRGLRLPTEMEWEVAAGPDVPPCSHFLERESLHPRIPAPGFFGNVWEWTASPYVAYPGFKPLPSSLGEYNGKFMCNQFVLRGGSCATPQSHIRSTYRNFFPPEARWQFSGLRLGT